MSLEYTRSDRINLSKHREFDESWLQDRIAEEPSLLGLGDLDLLARERRQERAGRLDLLLSDPDGDVRYEVELMLGATDASHIIRTLEYWDIERRRYPAYEHVAVLVAEDVTSRFLNVLSLLSGTVPLVAIQLSALQVGSSVVLHFTKVLDQRQLRVDEEQELAPSLESCDRSYWENRASAQFIQDVDGLVALLNEVGDGDYAPNYKRGYVGIRAGHRATNFVLFYPSRRMTRVALRVGDSGAAKVRLDDAGLQNDIARNGKVRVWLGPGGFEAHRDLMGELLADAARVYRG